MVLISHLGIHWYEMRHGIDCVDRCVRDLIVAVDVTCTLVAWIKRHDHMCVGKEGIYFLTVARGVFCHPVRMCEKPTEKYLDLSMQ